MPQNTVLSPHLDRFVHIKHPIDTSGLATLCGIMPSYDNQPCRIRATCPECIAVVLFCAKLGIR
jgi:hypothetical protein